MPASVVVWLRARKHLFDASMRAVKRTLTAVIVRMQALSATAKFMLMGMAGAVAGLVHLATKQEKAERKLAAVLRATGYAAGFSASQLQKEARELQKLTTYGDEVIMSMQGILATFVNIKGDVFRDATVAVLDMSAVLDQDLRSSVIMLGKALNDPILGVTALRRVGVQLSAQQVEMVKSFTDLGDIVSAQRVILAELKHEFGGVASAVSEGTGRITQLKNELGDTGEVIGKALIPSVISFLGHINNLVIRIVQWTKENPRLAAGLAKTGVRLLGIAALLSYVIRGFQALWWVVKKVSLGFSVLASLVGITSTVMTAALAVIITLTAWIGKLWYQIWRHGKEEEKANAANKKYVDSLNAIGEAVKKIHAAGTDKERIALLKERIKLERDAESLALDDIRAKAHRRIISGLEMEVTQLENVKMAAVSVIGEEEKAFNAALKLAQLTTAQAGKSAIEQEKLALVAKGFTASQVELLMIEKELAAERTKAADDEKTRADATADIAKKTAERLSRLATEIASIRGAAPEALEIIDLANLGHAKDDLVEIGDMLKERVLAETERETQELQKQMAARLAGEAMITAEREAQAAASMAGRFEGITSLWKRIQSATVKAPMEREAEQLRRTREIEQHTGKLAKIEEKASRVLEEISSTLDRILRKPPEPATFGV